MAKARGSRKDENPAGRLRGLRRREEQPQSQGRRAFHILLESHRPLRYSPSGHSSETGWSAPAPCLATSEKEAPASSAAEKRILPKRPGSTCPEQEHVRRNPPGRTRLIASRLTSL